MNHYKFFLSTPYIELTHFFLVHGKWSLWGGWSTCSETCGAGTQTRERTCDSPNPKNGGSDCAGDATGVQQCNLKECPGKQLS